MEAVAYHAIQDLLCYIHAVETESHGSLRKSDEFIFLITYIYRLCFFVILFVYYCNILLNTFVLRFFALPNENNKTSTIILTIYPIKTMFLSKLVDGII